MGINSGLPKRISYAAWNTETQEFVSADQAQHTITLNLDGTALGAPDNPIINVGHGVYEIDLTEAERSGLDLVLSGTSSSENVIITPVQYSADSRWNELLEDDGSGNLRNTIKSLEQAPIAYVNDLPTISEMTAYFEALENHGDSNWVTANVAALVTKADLATMQQHGDDTWATATVDTSGLATSAELAALQAHGDSTWATAVVDTSGLATTAQLQAVQSHGDLTWKTAVVDTSGLALETSVQTIIQTGGDGPWKTAVTGGLALEESVQLVLETGDEGPWTQGGGSSGGDWSADELAQIRFRLGVDGAANEPTVTVPDLTQKSDLDGMEVDVIKWAGSVEPVNSWAVNTGSIKLVTVDESTTSATSTEFLTNLTEQDMDHWKNRTAIFVTGLLTYQATVITAYELVNGQGKITVAGLTRAPMGGDNLIIV